MRTTRLLFALMASIFALTLAPSNASAIWKAKFGYKRYFDQRTENLFRLELGNDYKIAGPVHINVENAHEINNHLYLGQIALGLMLRFRVAKPLEITFRSDFIFDIGYQFKNGQDAFYGLGGLFGPGLAIKIVGNFGINLEVTAEVGKWLGIDDYLPPTTTRRLFWSMNFVAGFEF
ncbi:MAG: hypothetical protein KC609_12765 [Myxococcales bacterium]|nr:hypothetical protein [Myxococcales bacterium]